MKTTEIQDDSPNDLAGQYAASVDQFAQRLRAAGQDKPSDKVFLTKVLALLCDCTNSTAGIQWTPDDDGFLWQAGLGIGAKDAESESEYVQDVLANLASVMGSGEADIFSVEQPPATPQASNVTQPNNDSAVCSFRDLVLNHRQLVLPLGLDRRIDTVIVAFQQSTASAQDRWSVADLRRAQKVIEYTWSKMRLQEVTSDNSRSETKLETRLDKKPEPGTKQSEVAAPEPSIESQLTEQQRAIRIAEITGSSLDIEKCAYNIVNEIHAFLGEGRVSLGFVKGSKCPIRAISNQQVFDRRSGTVSAIERIASRVARSGKALWHPQDESRLPQEFSRLFDQYYEAADTQSIAFIPLRKPAEPSSDPNDLAAVVLDRASQSTKTIGVLVIEGTRHAVPREPTMRKWTKIETAVTNAASNAEQYNSLFLMPVWRELGNAANLFRGHLRNKALAVVGVLLLVCISLIAIPSDLRLRCDGIIQPAQRSRIFAESHGIIDELQVKDGQWVDEGQVLMTLRNPELSAEIASVEGELQETREKLKTCKLVRMRGNFASEDERKNNVMNCAGYAAKLDKLEEQFELLSEKRQQLTVKSPVSGQVVTWDTSRRLLARPVEPGQVLLTVANARGPWELELRLPDKRTGHLRRFLQDTNQPEGDGEHASGTVGPLATYVLASDPTEVREGSVREVAKSADIDEDLGNVVRVYVDLKDDPTRIDEVVRPGTEVIAHIHAGRASIGYCKLYEFIDWINRSWFRYL